jgi:hypothetical protein
MTKDTQEGLEAFCTSDKTQILGNYINQNQEIKSRLHAEILATIQLRMFYHLCICCL